MGYNCTGNCPLIALPVHPNGHQNNNYIFLIKELNVSDETVFLQWELSKTFKYSLFRAEWLLFFVT